MVLSFYLISLSPNDLLGKTHHLRWCKSGYQGRRAYNRSAPERCGKVESFAPALAPLIIEPFPEKVDYITDIFGISVCFNVQTEIPCV